MRRELPAVSVPFGDLNYKTWTVAFPERANEGKPLSKTYKECFTLNLLSGK